MKKPATTIPLIPFQEMKLFVKKILGVSKRESDAHIASLHASNVRRGAEKKNG